jgi:hypothetical protein
MESIQRMVPQDSPIVALAQQGAEAMGQIVAAAPSAKNPQGDPPLVTSRLIGESVHKVKKHL